MKDKEQYKRLIRFVMAVVLFAVEMIIYYFVWMKYYNEKMTIPYDVKGNYMIAAVYGIVLVLFANMFGGLKVGYLRIGNLIYSHILTAISANIMLYLQITLLVKHFYSAWPLFAMLAAEMVIIILWSIWATKLYRVIYPPRRVLMVYGNRPSSALMDKLYTRVDRFVVCESMNISVGLQQIEKNIGNYDGVVICDIPSRARNRLLKYCYNHSVRTYTIPKISDIIIRSAENLHLFDTPLLLSRNTGLNIEQRIVKRLMDILCSMVVLVITSPVMLVTAFLIRFYDGGPVLFKQQRCTKDGVIFTIYKFRSMIVDAEKDGISMPAVEHDLRITPIGRIIRAARIDELPQLFNILKGDMSLVGPRPERIEHVRKYTEDIPEFPFRMKVKGGLTGYAQVYGKYNTTAYDKLKLDLMYIENYSLLLDIEILFKTVKILFIKDSTEGFSDVSSQAMFEADQASKRDKKE